MAAVFPLQKPWPPQAVLRCWCWWLSGWSCSYPQLSSTPAGDTESAKTCRREVSRIWLRLDAFRTHVHLNGCCRNFKKLPNLSFCERYRCWFGSFGVSSRCVWFVYRITSKPSVFIKWQDLNFGDTGHDVSRIATSIINNICIIGRKKLMYIYFLKCSWVPI